MSPRRITPLVLLFTGLMLCAAAVTVRDAGSAPRSGAGTDAHRGGTLRVNESNADFDFVDPQLAYRSDDALMLDATSMQLVGYPDKPGATAGGVEPRAATAFPTVSKDGRTYTFHIRPGLRFSDGSPVTAAAFRRAFERILSPRMGSPLGVNLHLQELIVGGEEFLAGDTDRISGISANGRTLVIHLTRPNATFTSILAMTWFTAVKPNMPYSTTGLEVYPAPGPYYIASRDPGRSTVLERNPYYTGSRPANPDQIVFTPNTNAAQSLLQVKAGQADLDLWPAVPSTAAAALAKQYGVNKGRFWVGPTSCVVFMTMNTSRPPFDNVALRKAVEYAIDRPAQVRLLGPFAGRRTGQILVPGIPGYRPLDVYPIKGADVAAAQRIGGAAIAAAPAINLVHQTSATAVARSQVAAYNLQQVGFKVVDVPTPATTFYEVVGTRGTTYDFTTDGGWCADYFDPYDYLNVLFDGRQLQATNNAVDYSYFNDAAFNKALDRAAALTGNARAAAYARLDRELMVKYAPVVPYLVANSTFFTSSRLKNWVFSNYFGGPLLNALAVE